VLTVFPAAAGAEVQTIDFDTGTLNSPLGGQGDVTFPLSQGFRPYRTDVGIRAHSGTSVGDVGRCAEETEARGGEAGGCEFFQAGTAALLSRTAKSVTLFAGRFGPVDPFAAPEQAVLTAFAADGVTQLATTGSVPIGAGGFNTPLSVTDEDGRIASFRVRAISGVNQFAGDLGIDDLSVNFTTGGTPDFSMSTTSQIVPVVQGQSVEIPVQIGRLNGSNGPIQLSVTGLPKGVSAVPVTVPGARSTAEVTLTADFSAGDTNLAPLGATIVADPLGDDSVAPAPRRAAFKLRVARAYQLDLEGITDGNGSTETPVLVPMPDCAPRDVSLKIRRDIAFNKEISLSIRENADEATDLPRGIEAKILPGSVVSPGGGLVAERTLRLSADPNAYSGIVSLVLEARTAPGDPPHTIPIQLGRISSKAQIDTSRPGSTLGRTPRFGQPGTRIRVTGDGFCPGTTVRVGNELAPAPVTRLDPTTIEFNVPREATSGEVDIVMPGIGRYRASGELTVDSVRNIHGFRFENFALHHLSLSELTDAFGADDLFIKVNPCWPFGECSVVTGILNPMAAIDWGVMNLSIELANVGRDKAGHCFAMSLTARDVAAGKLSVRRFRNEPGSKPAKNLYELGGESGPGSDLESFLDAQQVKQFSAEAADAFFHRPKSLEAQLNVLREEFRRNRMVLVATPASPLGHATLAYDMVETPRTVDLFVYDANRPFRKEDVNPTQHQAAVAGSVIHIDKSTETWTLRGGPPFEKTGSTEGGFWVLPRDTIPEDPSLPGVGTLKQGLAWLLFGSTDGTVRTIADETSLPYFAGSGGSAGTGSFVGDPNHPLDVTFVGQKQGHYTQAYSAPGFIASVGDVATEKGVHDTVVGTGDTLRFESGEARPLSFQLAQRSGEALTSAATVQTGASTGGTDSAGFATDGALSYAHDGAPTTVDFTLTTVRRNGGPATFASGPVAVGRGDRLRAKPLDRELRQVRLTIRDARGRETSRVLQNRSRSLVRLKLGAARIAKHRLTLPVKVAGHGARAVLGASLRLIRGGRLVARKALALKNAGGAGRIAWRLPRSVRGGSYRLVVDARAVTSAGRGITEAGSATAHRVATVRVG